MAIDITFLQHFSEIVAFVADANFDHVLNVNFFPLWVTRFSTMSLL